VVFGPRTKKSKNEGCRGDTRAKGRFFSLPKFHGAVRAAAPLVHDENDRLGIKAKVERRSFPRRVFSFPGAIAEMTLDVSRNLMGREDFRPEMNRLSEKAHSRGSTMLYEDLKASQSLLFPRRAARRSDMRIGVRDARWRCVSNESAAWLPTESNAMGNGGCRTAFDCRQGFSKQFRSWLGLL
jgi:hypothetical protein